MAWVKSVITKCETLIQVTCGHCNVVNWIATEFSDDPSKVDDEGMTCWGCKKDSYFEPYYGDGGDGDGVPAEDESLMLGEGKKSPLATLEL